MKSLVIGSDHAGFQLKAVLKEHLKDRYRILDVGTDSEAPVDYPDFALKLGLQVRSRRGLKGILICGSGVGASVAANKIKGIRAAICHDHYSAHQGVEHDDMNVLVLGSRVIGIEVAKDLVDAFVEACFSREVRHKRRLAKVLSMESSLHP